MDYTYRFPSQVNQKFEELCVSIEDYYQETGSVAECPTGFLLLKKLLYYELMRPDIINNAAYFIIFPLLFSGHYLKGKYAEAWKNGGNQTTFWLAHTGARKINQYPNTMVSSVAKKINSFSRLVPIEKKHDATKNLGLISKSKAKQLGFQNAPIIFPGSHDFALSDYASNFIFRNKYPGIEDFFHLEVGTWSACSLISRNKRQLILPFNGYKKGIITCGSIENVSRATALYGGGQDFKYVQQIFEKREIDFKVDYVDLKTLKLVLRDSDCFLLPNISPDSYNSGPFPELKGKILNKEKFFNKNIHIPYIVTNLSVVLAIAYQIELISSNTGIPIVVTGGGSDDKYYTLLLSLVTGRDVYIIKETKTEKPFKETSSMGAALLTRHSKNNNSLNSLYSLDHVSKNQDTHLKKDIIKYRRKFLDLINRNT